MKDMKGLARNFTKLLFKGKEKNEKIEEKKIPDEMGDRDDQMAESGADEGSVKSEDAPSELKNKGKLFVGGLCHQTTSKGLEAYFSQFGKVLDAVVLRFPDNGRSRGFGFVTFADLSDAESAVHKDSHLLDGKNIDVRPFVSGKSNPKTSKKEQDFRVFLGGLHDSVSTDLLKEFFGRYGQVKEVTIPLDKNTKKPKGFGFLSFQTEEAVEKCLSEDFVHLGGRRIHVKRANPRSSSHSRDRIEIAEDCLESDALSVENLILWDNMSTSPVVDNETSSTVSGERSADFFSPQWSNFNAMYRIKTGEEERNFRELLSDFLVGCNVECCSGSDENLISFSDASESEESNSGTHSDCDSDVSDNDYGADAENETELVHQLQNELMKVLRDDPSAGEGDCGDVNTSSPMKFRDQSGSLFCPLCQWTPEDNSCESFLDHCKTASHRNKLKDRFPREQSQTVRHTEESKPKEKTDSKKKPSAQKTPVQGGILKSQDKIQTQRKGEKLNQAKKQRKAKNTEAKAVKKGGNVEIKNAPNNPKQEECENKDKANSLKGLKVMALAKGMSCIQPASGEHLKCKMCEKLIPKSEDFNVVMKNVSMHLQSRRHLKNLLQTENLLKESLENNQRETKNFKSGKNPPSQKTQAKAPSQEQKVPNQKTQAKAPSQEQKVPNQKVRDNASAQMQKNVTKNAETRKSQNKNSSSKLCFLCIPCNYLNSNIELFKAHLKSESHLDCFISRGVSTDLSFDNLSKCKSCDLYLYGSLYYINKHYSKCSEKKT